MAPLRAWIFQPPSSCLSSFSPSRSTTGGPATNSAACSLTSTEKCAAARCAAPRPATEPRPSATRGTVPMFSTTHSQPLTPGTFERPSVSMVLTEPPPPEPSTMRTSGRRSWFAICSHMMCFSLMVASAEPPRTVKSSPPTTTGRPSSRARPKTKLDGSRCSRSLRPSYCARPAMAPSSWKLPSSTSAAIRSRTLSRPPSRWRRTRISPPSLSAKASRRRSSSSSGCQFMAGFLPFFVSFRAGCYPAGRFVGEGVPGASKRRSILRTGGGLHASFPLPARP